MHRLAILLAVGFVSVAAPILHFPRVAADEIAGTIWARAAVVEPAAKLETKLNEWSRAARECRRYDATFTCWTYQIVCGEAEQGEVTTGRVVYQQRGTSRYENARHGGFVWRDDGYWILDRERNECRQYGKIDWAAVRKSRREPPPKELSWWEQLARNIANALFVDRTDVMPFQLAADLTELRDDYDLKLETTATDLRIGGSRKSERRPRFESVSFAFRGGDNLPYGVRLESAHQIVVYEYHEPWLHQPTPDADSFLNPDLSGFERIDMEAHEKSMQKTRDKILRDPAPAKLPR